MKTTPKPLPDEDPNEQLERLQPLNEGWPPSLVVALSAVVLAILAIVLAATLNPKPSIWSCKEWAPALGDVTVCRVEETRRCWNGGLSAWTCNEWSEVRP